MKDGNANIKGNKYENGIEEFEGEYLDGKKWNGKVKEYNSYNDKLTNLKGFL